MILFVAPNPRNVAEREGFMQRVAAIDNLFRTEEKVYFEDEPDVSKRARLIAQAQMVYVHSIYQAEKIRSAYPIFANKIVTDLHGIVPEEEAYAGYQEKSKHMAKVEAEVFRYGNKFVAVTQAMAEHFTKKYKLSKDVEWAILPVFNVQPLPATNRHNHSVVIYAGGAQSWQNVDRMVDAINKTYEKHKFTVLTHSPEAFSGLSQSALKRTLLKSVPSAEVANYYKDASLGFILRDDIPLNNVACPTKVIEYLACGVVPIVLSPNIGDFKALGYAYVTLDDFVQGAVTPAQVKAAAAKNLTALQRLEDLASTGSSKLKTTYEDLNVDTATKVGKLELELLAKDLRIVELEEKVAAYEYQVAAQVTKIEEYAEAMNYYKTKLDAILESKRWQMLQKLLRPAVVKNKVLRRRK